MSNIFELFNLEDENDSENDDVSLKDLERQIEALQNKIKELKKSGRNSNRLCRWKLYKRKDGRSAAYMLYLKGNPVENNYLANFAVSHYGSVELAKSAVESAAKAVERSAEKLGYIPEE